MSDVKNIQIPNITINGYDYWENHKTQYNNLIGEKCYSITLDLIDYPKNVTITIIDPSGIYRYMDTNDVEIIDYPLNKYSIDNLVIKLDTYLLSTILFSIINQDKTDEVFNNLITQYGNTDEYVNYKGVTQRLSSVLPTIINGE